MSKVKINNNQLIGVHEMDRLIEFLREKGYQELITSLLSGMSYGVNGSAVGLFQDASVNTFDDLKVSIDGSYQITVGLGKSINDDGEFMTKTEGASTVIATHTDTGGVTYYVKMFRDTKSTEVGTVSIAADGTLTGTDTKFTEFARSQGNVPLKINFPDSITNTGEYEVLSVSGDTSMVVNPGSGGSMTVEASALLSVIGAFTPGRTIPPSDKSIYLFDHYEFVHSNLPPLADEILLATIVRSGAVAKLTDERPKAVVPTTNLSVHSEMNILNYTDTNPLIGIIEVYIDQYKIRTSKMRVQWGYKANGGDWNATAENEIELTGGSGGTYKTQADISVDDFVGWYVYQQNGAGTTQMVGKIFDNTSSGINIYFRPDSGVELDSSKDIIIVPDCHTVSIELTDPSTTQRETNKIYTFATVNFEAYIDVTVPSGSTSATFNIKYSQQKGKLNSMWVNFPNSTYIGEEEWDYPEMAENGSGTTSYASGNINLKTMSTYRIRSTRTSLSLVNAWLSLSGSGTVGFTYDEASARVFLHGALDASTASNAIAATIPTNFLPTSDLYGSNYLFKLVAINGAFDDAYIDLDTTTGVMTISGYSTSGNYALNGVSWVIEPFLFDI